MPARLKSKKGFEDIYMVYKKCTKHSVKPFSGWKYMTSPDHDVDFCFVTLQIKS